MDGGGKGGDPFDAGYLRRGAWFHKIALWLRYNQRLQRVLRKLFPFAKLKGLRWVLRADHVREVLSRDDVFHVEGERIAVAGGGHNFMLGMERDSAACPLSYDQYQALVMRHFKLEDLPRVARIVAQDARAQLELEGAQGSVQRETIRSLITHSAIRVVEQYYGVPIGEADYEDLANCTCAVSQWLFDPRKQKPAHPQAEPASQRIRNRIAAAMAKPAADTILKRLEADPAAENLDARRMIVFGMILGFVPTSTMAGAYILEVLLDHPEMLEHARAAARGDDYERLRRCLFEAMRFRPLFREPLRVCARPYTVGEGTGKSHRFETGDRVLAITGSAMMDESSLPNPHRFEPDRSPHDSLVFGYGLHRCIGAPLAEVHLVETLRPLLQQNNLRRAGELKYLGAFPERLHVTFDVWKKEAP